MKLDQIISLLIGAGFGIRVLDARRAWWVRAAYGAVGFDLVRGAFAAESLLELPKLGAVGDAAAPSGKTLRFQEHKVRNIQERVAYIHEQMVRSTKDPAVYKLAREIVGARCGDEPCVPEKNALKGVGALDAAVGEVKAVHKAVQDRVRYVFDPLDYDAFQSARKTWEMRTGDCDCMIILEGALLRTIGIPVRTRTIQSTGFDTFNHIFLLAKMPNSKWVALDPIMKDKPAGWQVPKEALLREPFDADVEERGAVPHVPKADA